MVVLSPALSSCGSVTRGPSGRPCFQTGLPVDLLRDSDAVSLATESRISSKHQAFAEVATTAFESFRNTAGMAAAPRCFIKQQLFCCHNIKKILVMSFGFRLISQRWRGCHRSRGVCILCLSILISRCRRIWRRARGRRLWTSKAIFFAFVIGLAGAEHADDAFLRFFLGGFRNDDAALLTSSSRVGSTRIRSPRGLDV